MLIKFWNSNIKKKVGNLLAHENKPKHFNKYKTCDLYTSLNIIKALKLINKVKPFVVNEDFGFKEKNFTEAIETVKAKSGWCSIF